MTYTVNVPREPTPAMLNAAVDATGAGSGMSWKNLSPQSLFELGYRAMLAAAPKAEPVVSCKNCGTVRGATNECDCSRHDGSLPEWETAQPEATKADGMDAYTSDDMLNLISDEQARHLASSTDVSLVRSRMKDILNSQLADKSRRLNPAPKVEQEPVAKVVSAHGDPEAFGEREIEVLSDLSRVPYNTPLYTRPAPASDELLEASVNLQSARELHRKNPTYKNAMVVREASAALDAAIAKHKGPQS